MAGLCGSGRCDNAFAVAHFFAISDSIKTNAADQAWLNSLSCPYRAYRVLMAVPTKKVLLFHDKQLFFRATLLNAP